MIQERNDAAIKRYINLSIWQVFWDIWHNISTFGSIKFLVLCNWRPRCVASEIANMSSKTSTRVHNRVPQTTVAQKVILPEDAIAVGEDFKHDGMDVEPCVPKHLYLYHPSDITYHSLSCFREKTSPLPPRYLKRRVFTTPCEPWFHRSLTTFNGCSRR